MAWMDRSLRCDGCGIEIPLSPFRQEDHDYCCQDCAHGLECRCGERAEMLEASREAALASTAAPPEN